jgi:hypothetical protein
VFGGIASIKLPNTTKSTLKYLFWLRLNSMTRLVLMINPLATVSLKWS